METKFILKSKNFESYTYLVSFKLTTHYGEVKEYLNGEFTCIADNAKEAKAEIIQIVNDLSLFDQMFDGSEEPYNNLYFFTSNEAKFNPFNS